ncbi:MAG: DNA topoisomerase (ATP-hydrolyzing) subunit A, partial [Anaerolineae bacterium]
QGNFGSIDGDNAAAMRYTEARMYELGADMLVDIEKDTVDYSDNFDGSLLEPRVLPASFPNLLVNGASGIAVGMSTSIPPHNMGEVCDALAYMLDRWDELDEVGLADLMQFIKGPDFPTGGIVYRYNRDGERDQLSAAYASGRGKVTVQARAHIEQLSRNRSRIIITELPYQANKTNLIEKIADLVRDEKVEGSTDLRDESDRQGLRIVIDVRRTVDPEHVLSELYRLTPMRQTFSIIMLALVDDEPRTLTLKQALRVYIEHRLEIVRRRSEYDLARARERAHILAGYLIALENLDEIIDTIRRSRTVETARNNLIRKFSLTEMQAQAVLDMPLRRLAALERRKIQEEYEEKMALIEELETLLESPVLMRETIKAELAAIREEYDEPRRTFIVDSEAGSALSVSDVLPDEEKWVVLTESGALSRTFDDSTPHVTTAVKDAPRVMMSAFGSDLVHLFAASGKAAVVAAHQIQQIEDYQTGPHFSEIIPFGAAETIAAGVVIPVEWEAGFLVLASRTGMVKRIELEDLPGLTAASFEVMGLRDDELIAAALSPGGQQIVLVTAQGKAIRFDEDEVRPMGLPAGGVRGIKLNDDQDAVVGMFLARPDSLVWTATASGEAKTTPIDDYPVQGRYGQGVITMRLSGQQRIAAATTGQPDDTIVVVTNKGKPKYMRVGYAPQASRNRTGDSIIALGSNEIVTRVVTFDRRYNGDFV